MWFWSALLPTHWFHCPVVPKSVLVSGGADAPSAPPTGALPSTTSTRSCFSWKLAVGAGAGPGWEGKEGETAGRGWRYL